jgi:hypothetical protein
VCFRRLVTGKELQALEEMKAQWGDKSISLVGLHTIVVGVLCIALTWMGYLLYESVSGTTKAINTAIENQTKELTSQHVAIKEDMARSFGKLEVTQGKVADAMESQTFLLTKTDAERKLYKLDMPEGLRKRIR